MTLTASATGFTKASPQSVLEFVLDLELYRKVDRKIVRISSVDGPDESGRGSAKLWGRMWILPPAPDRQDFVLSRWDNIRFSGAPRQPARLIFNFVGTFTCVVEHGGTSVIHAYAFDFRGPFRVVERLAAKWLRREIEAEVRDLVAALDAS